MAYTEKYYLTFCDPEGNSCRVSILQDNFVGTATELIGQEDPIRISYDNSDDFKFKAIIESEASISLIFDDDTLSFSELWTSNERTFKVEYTINGDLEWTGFIIPEGFDYTLKGGKYPAELIARDGLSTLEGILFKTDNNEFYGTQNFGYNNKDQFPFILILTEILRKLDLGIDLWTLVDYYEQTMNDLKTDTRESDPLAISFVSVKTYINDTDREDIAYFEDINEAWDCKKILENICNIWGSRIYQEKGVWKFKSIHADAAIANPYNTESDPFVGENPTPSGIGTLFKWECYYSITETINFDNTQFFLSYYNTVSMKDSTFNIDFTAPGMPGFYLIKGLDKLIEINDAGFVASVKSYEQAVTEYYWKKYNNIAGYLGRELAKSDVEIPCSNKDIFLKDNDAEIRMDQVYKQFRVNYDYTFIRDGDSPVNLLKNGNFAVPFEQYGGLEAPPEWKRYRYEYMNKTVWLVRGRVIDIDLLSQEETDGNEKALEMHVQYNDLETPNTDPNPARWTSFSQPSIIIDQKIKSLFFKGYVKYQYRRVAPNFAAFYYPVFKAILYPYQINEDGSRSAYILENVSSKDYDLGWTKISDNNQFNGNFSKSYFENAAAYFITYPQMGSKWDQGEETDFKWYDFNLRVQPIPETGILNFDIHGICASTGAISGNFPAFYTYTPDGLNMKGTKLPTIKDMGVVPRPQFTGLELGYIPDPDVEVPKTDYIYANGDINYSFQEDPIRIYNGDTLDPEIVSGIKVLTNISTNRNKWDSFNNAFGKSDIGMILCKSIMQQYYKPNRLLDCDLKCNNLRYGDIIVLEHIPNVKFIMLRGTFNSKRGYWEDCTLAQITNDNVVSGGVSNGKNLDPEWNETGRVRCVKDENGLNTGVQEYETQDINSNSDSFGDFRWQESGENISLCPIGEPSKYYWGTDSDDYDVNNMSYFSVTYEDLTTGQVQLLYNNAGGNYIYLFHLASLGSVTQISNDFQSQIISSFTYIADVTINGYIYRVLRQDFVTSEFEDFLLTYYIQ